jgi:hypothetical protein
MAYDHLAHMVLPAVKAVSPGGFADHKLIAGNVLESLIKV